MKLFITGSTGFLGNNVLNYFKNSYSGDQLSLYANSKNLAEISLLELEDLKGFNFDYIFHLAAWTQAGRFSLDHPGEEWLINQKLNSNILEWWYKRQIQATLVSIGTSCAYDEKSSYSETEYLKGSPHKELFTYGMTKRMLQIGIEALNLQFQMKYLSLIPNTLFGFHYHWDKKQPHFIYDLILKSLKYKYHRSPITIWGDGSQKRELVYVEDFIRGTMELISKNLNGTFNISPGIDYTIIEYLEMIAKTLDIKLTSVFFDLKQITGVRRKILNNSKFREACPNFSFTPLDSILPKIVLDLEEKYLDFLNKK